ncbi:MAG: hypothetical protein JW931_03905 [Methanomicrobiaceae archaeon]|nr:hypothetical protein [Methanomicrobiaceae archaeon]
MIHNRAVEIVRNIFESASYDVEEGDGLIDLSAYLDDECIVVLCSDERGKIDEFNKKTIKVRLGDRTAECQKLLFTMDNTIRAENCIVWGHSELSKYSGQAAVAYVLNEYLALDLKREERKPAVQEYTTSRPTLDDYGPEIPLINASITEDKARKIAGIKGDIRRLYIPHYLFRCTGSGEKQYKTHLIDFNAEESGLINAISGTPASLEIPDFSRIEVSTRSVPTGSKILKPEKEKKDTEDIIFKSMKEKLTRNVRISKTEGDTISYEDIEVSPDKENLKIEIDLVYLPVIQIRGSKIVEIETFSGSILKEPMDDGVELL